MSLHFSDDGPEFPGDLVDSLLNGEVVFLCGSGVSRPQLPDFKELVEGTYERLSLDMLRSEERAFESGRYEEVLASLKQRLVDPEDVTRSVSDLLTVPTSPCLDHHCTILRLARDSNNRITVVTTNFDTLLERAAATLYDEEYSKKISSAGQALPAPGSSDFAGIVHIHGRLADPVLGLEQSPLVLTSIDFGEAYMRSGWASRFFFDLVRCKDIVLVGYSAKDVPIRYMLNVLEADRARFSDLRRVYAFAEYTDNKQEAAIDWQTLAVETLPYRKINEDTRKEDHGSLWRDLRKLGDVVERPQEAFRTRVSTILKQDVAESCAQSQREIVWLLKEPRDLWSVALDAIVDSQWFDFFQQEKEWPEAHIAKRVSFWIRRDLQDADRFDCALRWQRRMGQPFTQNMAELLRYANNLNPDWRTIWRLFCLAVPAQCNDTDFSRAQALLDNEIVLDCDLRVAVAQLTPKLELGRSPRELEQAGRGYPLASLLNTRIDVSDSNEAKELADSLCKVHDRALRILELATWELRTILELEKELGQIRDKLDRNDRTVPSVESHPQNELHGGKVFLVQLLSECLPRAHALDREGTKSIVECWKHFPGRIGLRLHLHAMRDSALFCADDAISTLLSVSEQDFWQMRREPALLIKDRSGDASPKLVSDLERLLIDSSRSYFGHYELRPKGPDWREHARANVVWLHLKMLKGAGALSHIGANELASIIGRHSHLDRAINDRDFFDPGTYISPARWIDGDPGPIVQAQAEDRLRVARKKMASGNFEEREGWAAYCRTDPAGALNALSERAFNPADSKLWITLLYALAFSDSLGTQLHENLPARALVHLLEAETADLHSIVPTLCTLVRQTWESHTFMLDEWITRLWGVLVQHPEQETDYHDDLYKQAIESSAGQLTEVLLLRIEALSEAGSDPTTQQLQLLNRIAECPSTAGLMGRAVLVYSIAFLVHRGLSAVVKKLEPALYAEDKEGKELRVVALQYLPTSAEAATHIKNAILKGLQECGWDKDRFRRKVASWVVFPALAGIEEDTTVQWGITTADAADVLKKSSPALLIGAIEVLNDVLSNRLESESDNPEAAWSNTAAPFFKEVWPHESKFRNEKLTPGLLRLAVSAGHKFPEAWRILQPYISPGSLSFPGLHVIDKSQVPETFPNETLELLWTVCGRNNTSNVYGLSDLLDRLVRINPNLETDRRLQRLKQRANRL